MMDRKVNIIEDLDGKKTVFIHDILFTVIMVIRHDKDGRMYLYDIMNIKKETSTLFRSEDVTQ